YRLKAEEEAWKLKDPIERVKAYLVRNDLADTAFLDEVEAEAKRVAKELREGCLALPDPAPLSMFEHVYAEDHPLMTEEQEQFAAYLASFEEEVTS
ncbi:MAG TPA: pyruvate dehydrogenase (acetyl-transferring) E1 component subunit alpha, partial [Spirillospora sp.]|nr:pyruvate dehydrogenase (acetyl-transferring) E1 component subunit alpha [Spirillospora sp.]